MTDPPSPAPARPHFQHLGDADAARLPADLDHAAVDELLGLMPPEVRGVILLVLAQPPKSVRGTAAELAAAAGFGSEDPHVLSVLARVYASRAGHTDEGQHGLDGCELR